MTFKYGAFSGLTRELPRVFIRGLILAELTHKKKKRSLVSFSLLASQLSFQIFGGRKTGENQGPFTGLINQTEQICSCFNMVTSIKSELPGGRDSGFTSPVILSLAEEILVYICGGILLSIILVYQAITRPWLLSGKILLWLMSTPKPTQVALQ